MLVKPSASRRVAGVQAYFVPSNDEQETDRSASMTIAVGCELEYAVQEPTTILLAIQPHLDADQILVDEFLLLSCDRAVSRQVDHHGNRVLQCLLPPGRAAFSYSALVVTPDLPDNAGLEAGPPHIETLPLDTLRYTFPSRYCESDRLQGVARQLFGHLPRGAEQARAICEWVHRNFEYRYGSGSPELSAVDVLQRGYGVCRDFAHVMIALCRALDLPARYVAGHIPRLDANAPDEHSDMGTDFHAYCEVYLGRSWHTFDPRHHRPLKGRIKVAHGMDAVDAAFATLYGCASPSHFRAWSEVVETNGTP